MDTLDLIKRCTQKNHEAWDEFIERYRSVVVRGVRFKLNKIGKDVFKGDYDDIVQEIFMFLWEDDRISSIKDAACLESWLVMVSMNFTQNYVRRVANRTRELSVPLSAEISTGAKGDMLLLEDILPCSRNNLPKNIEDREIGRIISDNVEKLEYKQKLAFKLNMYERKTHEDISDIMSLPRNTVSTLIRRAKGHVRENLVIYLNENNEKKCL
ncbi:MAG TPA: sigma-70 family RNA polymerase sigma factor [Candidatus Omnitrophota bacterium]|nr:sigma-70 family RNA polymerase sigma factor [Candidatus Omnitrophota bacterium]HPS21003.1 sigma-70 family RNA polymerase sigma factor [Candidatus Omnitrophota bacterium]